jgi:hypothetical protein
MFETVFVDPVWIGDDVIGTAIDLASVGVVDFLSEVSLLV